MVYNWHLFRINENCGGTEVGARKPKFRAILILCDFKSLHRVIRRSKCNNTYKCALQTTKKPCNIRNCYSYVIFNIF